MSDYLESIFLNIRLLAPTDRGNKNAKAWVFFYALTAILTSLLEPMREEIIADTGF